MTPTTQASYLVGRESLEAGEVGWGLEGAENIGHEGERGEGGLGHAALTELYTHTHTTYAQTSMTTSMYRRTHICMNKHACPYTHTHTPTRANTGTQIKKQR